MCHLIWAPCTRVFSNQNIAYLAYLGSNYVRASEDEQRNCIFKWFYFWIHVKKAQNWHFSDNFCKSKDVLPFLLYFRSYLQKNSSFGQGKTELWCFLSSLAEISLFPRSYTCLLGDSVSRGKDSTIALKFGIFILKNLLHNLVVLFFKNKTKFELIFRPRGMVCQKQVRLGANTHFFHQKKRPDYGEVI